MATVRRQLAAHPADVWAVLSDGWTYSNWVVGTSHIRAVADAWPAVGSKLKHASGIWPLALLDETTVLESRPDHRLVLQAKGRPFGEATVTLVLDARDGGCLVTLGETPTKGPGAWLNNPLAELAVKIRNVEALRRLAALAEKHRP